MAIVLSITALAWQWKAQRDSRKDKTPLLQWSHELIAAPTMKGFRRIAGIRVTAANAGGGTLFVRSAHWRYDGAPVRDAWNEITAPESAAPLAIAPGAFIEIVSPDGSGDPEKPINELCLITQTGEPHVHAFELVPPRSQIAVIPGDWPPRYEVRGFN